MNNYAIIENGVVVNVIVGPLPDGISGVPIDGTNAAIGDHYENGEFIKPEPVAEQSLESKIHALEAQLSALKKQIAK